MNTNELLQQICKDEAFKIKLSYGLQNNLILKWDADFLESLRQLNIFSGFSFSFIEVFDEGANIGTCYETARALSFLFENFTIHTGFLHALDGTQGAPNGEHAWLQVGSYYYDTTMMLKIHKDYADVLGYKTVSTKNSEDFKQDHYYQLQKAMAFEDNSWYFEHKNVFKRGARTLLS